MVFSQAFFEEDKEYKVFEGLSQALIELAECKETGRLKQLYDKVIAALDNIVTTLLDK